MTIGGLSRLTGCKVETIRYYERIGILPEPARGEGGHRVFGQDTVARLSFVMHARGFGFSLDAVRALLALSDGPRTNCVAVERIAAHHLDDVRRKLDGLVALERALSGMVEACRAGTTPECPIIEALFDENRSMAGGTGV